MIGCGPIDPSSNLGRGIEKPLKSSGKISIVMNILVSFCGVGFGHATRCISVGKELEKQGHNVLYSSHGRVYSDLAKAGLTIEETGQELKMKHSKDEVDALKTFIYTSTHARKATKNIRRQMELIDDFEADVVLADGYLSAIPAARIRKKPVAFMANQTNTYAMFDGVFYNIPRMLTKTLMKNMIKFSNACIIPDFPQPHTICRKNVHFFNMKKKFHFTGPVIKKYFDDVKEKEFPKDTYLITLGGSGIKSDIEQYLEGINANFIVLNAEKNKKRKNIVFKKYVKDVFPYLKAVDGVITHGGHSTIMEALAFGKPVIGVHVKGFLERENNLRGVEKNLMGLRLKKPENIEAAIEKLKKDKMNIKKYRDMGKKHKGTQNTIKILENLAKKQPTL